MRIFASPAANCLALIVALERNPNRTTKRMQFKVYLPIIALFSPRYYSSFFVINILSRVDSGDRDSKRQDDGVLR